jgi:hypothetical protein
MMQPEQITDDITEIVGEWSTPCDFSETWAKLPHGEAGWVAHRVMCVCGKAGGARLICTGCKDVLMLSEDALQCVSCDEIYQPARTIVSSIEAI